jgi:hypothetical protein
LASARSATSSRRSSHHIDRDIHQVANHGFDVAAHVADLGKLAGFHLQKWRIGQLREAARDLRLSDSGWPNHQNVLGHDLFGHFGREFLTADAIAQGDGNGALGVGLADHVLVQLAHDFARRQLIEYGLGIDGLAGKIDHHR